MTFTVEYKETQHKLWIVMETLQFLILLHLYQKP